jgi:hypothetical protein
MVCTAYITCNGASASGRKLWTLHWIREGVSMPFKNNRPPSRFNQGVSLQDATLVQLEFVDRELARFVQAGAWEPSTCNDYVSRLFLVPKPANNHWRLICDLRQQNKNCVWERLEMETILGSKHVTRKGDYILMLGISHRCIVDSIIITG